MVCKKKKRKEKEKKIGGLKQDTNALSLLCGILIASLRYLAPSSSMQLEERSRISKVLFCFKTSDRHLAPSRVILLL